MHWAPITTMLTKTSLWLFGVWESSGFLICGLSGVIYDIHIIKTHLPQCRIYVSVKWISIGSDNDLPSHYLNQCWIIVNPKLRNKLQWNINQNTKIFIHENVCEITVFEMAVICPGGEELIKAAYGRRIWKHPWTVYSWYIAVPYNTICVQHDNAKGKERQTLNSQ